MSNNKGIIQKGISAEEHPIVPVPLVPLQAAEPAEPFNIPGEPTPLLSVEYPCLDKNDIGENRANILSPLLTVEEAAGLVERTERGIRKIIASGKVDVERVPSLAANRKGKEEYRIVASSLFAIYPNAKVAWLAQKAEAQRRQDARNLKPLPTISVPNLLLRAKPDKIQRAQSLGHARQRFLDLGIRPFLAHLSESQRYRTAQGWLPLHVTQQAIQWLLTEEGRPVLEALGKVPGDAQIKRWWAALMEDPSGELLIPRSWASGRQRTTDKRPDLLEEILAAYAFTRSFKGATDVLQAKGIDISEPTVRRRLGEMTDAVLQGIKVGVRKAMTDKGPYVRRKPSLPYQCWSIDGHTWDALTLWDTPLPGEELAPFRPKLYMVRDVGSGAYLSIQLGNSLNRYLVYMAIAEAIIRFGVIPEALQTDNGSEIANKLMLGDEDTYGYFEQLGMTWSEREGGAFWRNALPYNSRSKPIERDFRTLSQSLAARLPAYVGSNPSRRPGDPLKVAHQTGAYETVATLKVLLAKWLEGKIQETRTVQRHRIVPINALTEQKARLVEELGANHPRFVRPGQEWRVLPSLKGRLVRGMVEARIEGQVLRYSTPILDGLQAEGLEVRLWPWDVSRAWLCRGGELLDQLTFEADAPELGSGSVDVVTLRHAKLLERRQKGLIKAALRGAESLRQEAGMAGIGLPSFQVPVLPKAIPAPSRPDDFDPAELDRQRERLNLEQNKARQKPEDAHVHYQRLLIFTEPSDLTEADREWIRDFETTPEGKGLKDLLKDYRRDGV
jgi:hypothetical protein